MRISPASRTGLGLTALVLGGVTALLAACGGDGQECRFGADCESGRCSVDGLCLTPGDGTSSGNAGSSGVPGTSSGGSSGSSGSSTSSSSGSSGTTSSSSGSSGVGCVANMDGTITKDEVPQQAGLLANFRFASNATVDLAGVVESGTTKWNLSGPYPGDYDVEVPTKPAAGSWYSSSFPTASYSVLLGKKPAEARGVLRADDSALSLLGLVSNTDEQPSSSTETNMVYDVAVATLKFPLTEGSRWDAIDAHGTGKLAGYAVPLYGTITDTYRSVVDARGALVTPFGIFPVLRVVTSFHRSSNNALLITDTTTIAFVSECAGTVAKLAVDEAVAVEGKSVAEIKAAVDALTTAVEVQRLAPPL